LKIFWSWQSDTPGKIGRHFVRDVLNAAIDELKQSLEVDEPSEREAKSAIHLDHDRKGVAGSPDLARTILEKIENSAVFVADVTPVGFVFEAPDDLTSAVTKKIINPNVAIELGYALHALSDSALLMVMNEHYGSRAELPFDLQSKAGPIMFRLAPDADKGAVAAAGRALEPQLVEALNLCIATNVEDRSEKTLFAEAEAKTPAFYFAPSEILATVGFNGESEYRFEGEKAVYIRIFPKYAKQSQIGLAKLTGIFQAQKPCPMTMIIGGIPSRNRFGPIIYDPIAASGIAGLTQGFENGELWGLNGKMFAARTQQVLRPTPGQEVIEFIPMIAFEKLFVRVLENYAKVMTSELKLQPPYIVEFGAVGLDQHYLGCLDGSDARGQFVGPIMKNSIQRRYELKDTNRKSLHDILRSFFNDFYDLAAFSREQHLTAALTTAHQLPSLMPEVEQA
jgi:hypothetical protein